MEQQHIACIDVASDPITALLRPWRNITSFPCGRLWPKAMGSIENSQWPLHDRAIMKRYPGRKALLVSSDGGVVLVRVHDATRELRKNDTNFRLWMYQKLLSYE